MTRSRVVRLALNVEATSDRPQLQPLADLDEAVTWAMVESSPDGMLLANEHGVLMLVNEQIETLFGYDRGELLGLAVETLLPERHRDVHTAHRTRYRAEASPRPMGADLALIGRRQDGTEFPVEVSLSPITTKQGLRVVATVRDITDRLAVLARGHAVLEMIDATHDGVFMLDAETLTFTYVNHGAEVQLGYTGAELLAMSPLHITPDYDESRFRALLEPLLSGEFESYTFTTMHRRRDGHDVPVEITLDYPSPVDPRQQRVVVALVRDITVRLATEAGVRRNESRLRVLQDRERLARDMHDIVIQRLFAAGMGLQAVVGSITDAHVEQRVSDTVDELDRTIADLRVAIFELTNVSASTVAEQIDEVIEHAAVQLAFAPTIVIDGDVDSIPAELREHLVPALTEALSNVARHARAATVSIALRIDSETISLTVVDDGVGIGSTGTRGNGLDNLAARAHEVGGTVSIQSHPDRGTTLTWTTPRQTATSHPNRDQISEAAGDRSDSHSQHRDHQHREPRPAIR